MNSNENSASSQQTVAGKQIPTLRQALRIWLRIGLLSFGGPAAQIALMHRMLVDENQWLDEKTYLNALSFCMLLPGPEAMQLATYAGWRLHGTVGGLVAGLLFVLPGALVVLLLALLYVVFGNVPLVETLFIGIKAAVLVIVLEALIKVSRRALGKPVYWLIAAAAFIGIFFLSLPFPMIVLGAGIAGFIFSEGKAEHHPEQPADNRSSGHLLRTVVLWLLIWALPLLLVALLSPHSLLVDVGAFFSRLAVVTFGGAYAVLAYMGQAVVEQFGWLSAGEMMDGLGLAETTPGPLILVTEFVGFIAGYRQGGIGLALVAALITLWTTFVPCFLWIFAGAPYINWIGNQPRLRDALRSITAAVVGVILNLSIWFALHVLFDSVEQQRHGVVTLWAPVADTFNPLVLVLTLLSALLLLRLHWSIFRVLLVSAVSALAANAILV